MLSGVWADLFIHTLYENVFSWRNSGALQLHPPDELQHHPWHQQVLRDRDEAICTWRCAHRGIPFFTCSYLLYIGIDELEKLLIQGSPTFLKLTATSWVLIKAEGYQFDTRLEEICANDLYVLEWKEIRIFTPLCLCLSFEIWAFCSSSWVLGFQFCFFGSTVDGGGNKV